MQVQLPVQPVQFNNYRPPDQSFDNCNICFDPIKDKVSVAHSAGGEKHPIHKDCLIKWLKINEICPTCRVKVDVNSVLTWKDKAIVQLKLAGKDAIPAVTWGLIGMSFIAFVKNFAAGAEEINISTIDGTLAMGTALLLGNSCKTTLITRRMFAREGLIPVSIVIAPALATVASVMDLGLGVPAAVGTAVAVEAAGIGGIVGEVAAVVGAVAGNVLTGVIRRRYFN